MKPKLVSAGSARLISACALLLSGGGADAASIAIINTVRYDGNQPVGNNLTTQGSVDWTYWAAATSGGTSYGSEMVPTNDKLGGSAISNLSLVGSGNLRASDTADASARYTWTDGSLASWTSRTNQNLPGGLIFSSALNTPGAGFSLTVAGAVAGQTYYVMLYLGGFAATGNLSLSLPGVLSPVTDNTQVFGSSAPKSIVGYQVAFTPDSANDSLTVSYTSSATTSNGHVGIEAVVVGTSEITPVPPIPEPTAAMLGGLGSLLLFLRRKA